MHADLLVLSDACLEHVAGHHLRVGDQAQLADEFVDAHLLVPLRVAADLENLRVVRQNDGDLLQERGRVAVDLLGCQDRPSGRATGRVTDPCGRVAEQKDHRVAEILQVPHHPEVDCMSEVQLGRGAINPELDAQLPARGQSGDEVFSTKDLVSRSMQPFEDGLRGGHDVSCDVTQAETPSGTQLAEIKKVRTIRSSPVGSGCALQRQRSSDSPQSR